MAKHNHYMGGEAARHFAKSPQPYHVMIATPSSRGFPTAFVMSIVATIESLVRFGVRADFHVLDGDCHVDDARNKIFREFLCTNCTDLFFIDSDMGWSARDVLHLLKADGDIVAGIYRHKNDEETYPFHPGENCARTAGPDGLYDMPKLPTGFMRIRRPVIEALHKREVDLGRYFWDSPEDEATGKPPIAAICERAFASEMKLSVSAGDKSDRHSGDLVLCLKARHLGFSCRADIEMQFKHVGEKEWIGHLGNNLRREQGVDHQSFIDAVTALKLGAPEAADFEKLNAHSSNAKFALPGVALKECWEQAKAARGNILELGAGLSTLVMGLALEGTDKTIHAFECDLAWFKATGKMLERHGIKNVVLHYLPLMPYEGFDWYGVDGLELPDFDVVLIDGPARKTAPRAAVFDLMGDVVEKARVWIIDDMADPTQQAMLEAHKGNRKVRTQSGLSAGVEHVFVVAEADQAERAAA